MTQELTAADTLMATIDKKLKPAYRDHEGSQQSAVRSPQVSPLSCMQNGTPQVVAGLWLGPKCTSYKPVSTPVGWWKSFH